MNRTRVLSLVIATVAVAGGATHFIKSSGAAPQAATPATKPVNSTPRPSGGSVQAAEAKAPRTTAPEAVVEVAARAPAETGLPAPAPAPLLTLVDADRSAADAAPGPLPAPAAPAAPLAAAADPAPQPVVEAPAEVTAETVAEAAPAQAESAPAAIELAEDCTPMLSAFAQPGAMLELALLAPCDTDARVVIRHGGLAVTALTSGSGALVASIPALADPAQVAIVFPDGSAAETTVRVPDLAGFDRFAVQWMEGDAFHLHAFEGRAEYGMPGHVWAQAPRRSGAAGGFLTVLGEPVSPALMAEVYTYPAGLRIGTDGLRVDLEAPVTMANCAGESLAETIQIARGVATLRDLSIAMPGCDFVGESVVLHDAALPERLAAN